MRNQTGKWLYIPDNFFVVGIVATNQTRKDFGLGIQVVAELAKDRPTLLWIHTDELERHWSIPALLNDFGLKNHAVTTVPLSDEQMSYCYSACDVTLGIGTGEGYGYPIFESLACGVPCIHGAYGGAAEHMESWMLVGTDLERLEGPYNCVRPVYDHHDWVCKVSQKDSHGHYYDNTKVSLPPHLDWRFLWPRWEQWLKAGVE